MEVGALRGNGYDRFWIRRVGLEHLINLALIKLGQLLLIEFRLDRRSSIGRSSR